MPRRDPPKAEKTKPTGPWDDFVPPDMSEPAAAEYHRLVAVLTANKGLRKTDPQLVVTAARVKGLIDQADEAVRRDGLMITPKNGYSYANPLIGQIGSLALKQKGLLHEMGLTLAGARLLPFSWKADGDKDDE